MKQNTALIADIIQSRKSDNRYEVQKKLLLIINFLNKVYQNSLIRKVDISSGDSFQGLFVDPGVAFLYIRMLQMLLYPTKIRVGIGIGYLDYIDNDFGTNLLDGEAYHNARDAINLISQTSKEQLALRTSKVNSTLENSLNIMLDMYYKLRQSFGANSLRISLVNELLNPMSLEGDIHYLGRSSENEIALLNDIVKYSFTRSINHSEVKETESYITKEKEIEPFLIAKLLSHKRQSMNSSDYVLRGIQDNVGSIIGTSRQNVQKYYSRGVSDERMYATYLINLMNEVVK